METLILFHPSITTLGYEIFISMQASEHIAGYTIKILDYLLSFSYAQDSSCTNP